MTAPPRLSRDQREEGEETDELDLDPLDLAILEALPDEGTRIGKYLLDSRTAKQLARELDDKPVTPTVIGRRFIELRKFGYAVGRTRGSGSTHWQRTKLGASMFKADEQETTSDNGQGTT